MKVLNSLFFVFLVAGCVPDGDLITHNSIGPIYLGMPVDELRMSPLDVRFRPGEAVFFVHETRRGEYFERCTVIGDFDTTERVSHIVTRSPLHRTADGLGPGSSRQKVIEQLGRPSGTTRESDEEILLYRNATGYWSFYVDIAQSRVRSLAIE